MFSGIQKISLSVAASCTFSLLLIATIASAQSITPSTDGTGTTITINGRTYDITGGTLSGDGQNLFHSFESFGLTQQEIANFLSNPAIRNILGRVVGGSPSQIDGLLKVSGGASNLYLMNPAGIVFGPNAQLNVPGSFAATTASSIDFATGQFSASGNVNYPALVGAPQSFTFTAANSGSIVNTGDLAVGAGKNLTLVGSTVINTGTLTAPGGTITVLAVPGTDRVRLSQKGAVLGLAMNANALAQVPASQPIAESLADLVTGGNPDIASTIQVDGQGRVWLAGVQVPDEAGTAIVSGELNAASNAEPGGTVKILGQQVAALDATINASGTSGGEVLIGGDLQGGGAVPTAQYTVVDNRSVIRADALTQGNGGKVIVWADGTTQFAGDISARGGLNAGDGGFVEVSGLQTLNFTGTVNTDAPNGASGSLLLDPTDITITPGGTPGGFSGTVLFGAAGPTVISEAQLENLAGNTNVTIQASNSITIQQMTDSLLTFQPGSGTISFEAGGAFVSNSGIDTNARDISITAGSITFNTPTLFDIDAGHVTGLGSTSGDGGSINLTSTNGDISFEAINTNAGSPGTSGDVNIQVSPGNNLTFLEINTGANSGPAFDGNITINGVAQPKGLLRPGDVVGGMSSGANPPAGVNTAATGNSTTVNVNGAIVNIGSSGSRNNNLSGSGPSVPGVADQGMWFFMPGGGWLNTAGFATYSAFAQIDINNTTSALQAQERQNERDTFDAEVKSLSAIYSPDSIIP